MNKKIFLIDPAFDKADGYYDTISTLCTIYTGLDVMKTSLISNASNDKKYSYLLSLVDNSAMILSDLSNLTIEKGIVLKEANEKGIPVFIIHSSVSIIPDIVSGMNNVCKISEYKNNPIDLGEEIVAFSKQNKMMIYRK